MVDLIRANKRRTAALVVVFIVLHVLLGALLGLIVGQVALVALVALVVASMAVVATFWKAEAIVLHVSRAVPVDDAQYPRLHNLVEGLCVANGLPKPRVHLIEDAAPNAFVAGRSPDHASIAVTTGLLEQMERVELEGVLARELSHVRSHDILVSTSAVVLVGLPVLVADLALRLRWWNGGRIPRAGDRAERSSPVAYIGTGLLWLSPLVSRLMKVAVNGDRTTMADLAACQMTRFPPGLISALEKLDHDVTVVHAASCATAHLWSAQPLSGVGDAGQSAKVHAMFDTHPPLQQRIALLREL